MATQQPTLKNMILTVTEDFDTLMPESTTAGEFNRFAMTGNVEVEVKNSIGGGHFSQGERDKEQK
jgi:chorismate mutase